MELVVGNINQLSKYQKIELFKYRHDIFVKKLGWELNTPDNIEVDQFDNEDSVYVIAKKYEEIVGCARLLPTTRPYLLEEVFPELLNGLQPPKSEEIWEVSRFTNSYLSNGVNNPDQIGGVEFGGFLKEVMRVAKREGAKKLISVSPIGIERLLRKSNIKAHRAGKPMIVNGHSILACWIDIDQLDEQD